MKLYHATKKSLVDYIKAYGALSTQVSEKVSNDERLNKEAVYGFDNFDDAYNFIVWDNNSADDYAIFSFDAENVIIDIEYEDGAYAVEKEVKWEELTLVEQSE